MMVSLKMGRPKCNMLLGPYKDLNGYIKYNVIFHPVDRKLDVIPANNSWHREKEQCATRYS